MYMYIRPMRIGGPIHRDKHRMSNIVNPIPYMCKIQSHLGNYSLSNRTYQVFPL